MSVPVRIRLSRAKGWRKPDEQYARIEALVDGPRLELFSRTKRAGWDEWGNDTDRFGEAA